MRGNRKAPEGAKERWGLELQLDSVSLPGWSWPKVTPAKTSPWLFRDRWPSTTWTGCPYTASAIKRTSATSAFPRTSTSLQFNHHPWADQNQPLLRYRTKKCRSILANHEASDAINQSFFLSCAFHIYFNTRLYMYFPFFVRCLYIKKRFLSVRTAWYRNFYVLHKFTAIPYEF